MRKFTVECWTCGGHGITGRFLNRNIHVSFTCPTCNGRGYKQMRRYKR